MGFRVNNLFGDGIKEPLEVIVYEIYDLGNTDVLNTLANTLFKDTEFGCQLKSFCQATGVECKEKAVEIFVHKLIQEVEEKLGKKIKSVLWLCDTVQDLVDCYGVQDGSVVSEYENGFVVLSDLGRQGKLYGYEEEPKCLRERGLKMRLEEFQRLIVTDDVEGIRDFDGKVTRLNRKAYLELDRVPGLDWGKTVKDVSRLVELVPRLGNIAGTAEPKEDVATLAIGEDSCYLAEPILEWTVQEENRSVHNIWVTESDARKIREVERKRIERALGFNCTKMSIVENDHRIVCNEYKKGTGNTTIFNQPFYIQSVATEWGKPFVELAALEVFKREDRGNGIGTKALQRILKVYEGTPVFGLCTYLDDECREEPEGYLERLLGFYERNGFINVNDCLGGYENGYTLVHPNGNKECEEWVSKILDQQGELSAFDDSIEEALIQAYWSGEYPTLCCGVWTLVVNGEDVSTKIPEELRTSPMNTRGEYKRWKFDDNNEEITIEYTDGLKCEDWIKENKEWLDTITTSEEVQKKIFEAINKQDFRPGSCGGCVCV